MKKIAIFNHKGGVSKTTSALHIGWKLAEQGKKVLLIDADSQCNLSLTILGSNRYEQFYRDNNHANIKDAVAPAFKASTTVIQSVECIQVPNNDNLFLLPGSINLSEWEVALGVSFQLSNTFGTMQNLPGSFNFLIEKTAEKYNTDFVLIDMNPSLSAINQALLVCSDYFIIPTSPDYYSVAAIKSLTEVLPKWENWAKKAREIFAESVYPLPNVTPKFLGYIVSDFNIRNGEATTGYKDIIKEIDDAINNLLVPKLRAVEMANLNATTGYSIGSIPNFNTLGALSQKKNKPIFKLNKQDTGHSGNVWDTERKSIENFDEIYNNIVNSIIKTIDLYEPSLVTV